MQTEGQKIPLFLVQADTFLIGSHQSICLHNSIIISRFQERRIKGIMNRLDRLYFYLRAKFFELCLRISFWIDEVAGFEIPDGEEGENSEDGENDGIG